MSKPSIGDTVLYKPNPVAHPNITYAALVGKVSDDTINLAVIDDSGSMYRAVNIPFIESGSVPEPYAFPKVGGVIVPAEQRLQNTENPDHGDDSDIVRNSAVVGVAGLATSLPIEGGIAQAASSEVTA